MSKPFNLSFHRILKRQESYFSEVRQEVADEIAFILTVDLTNLNGRELRKLRNNLISLQRMAAATSSKVRERIAQKHDELGRELTSEEISECLGPIRPIRFLLGRQTNRQHLRKVSADDLEGAHWPFRGKAQACERKEMTKQPAGWADVRWVGQPVALGLRRGRPRMVSVSNFWKSAMI
jgi:hypothetical protein